MLKKKMYVAMIFMLILSWCSSPVLNVAFADNIEVANSNVTAKFKSKEIDKMVKESQSIFPFVKKVNNKYVVDSEKARQNGVSDQLIKETEEGFIELNQKISKNKLSTLGSCGGVSKTVSTNSGKIVYLNSCEANELSYALGIKSGVAAAVAAILSPIVPAGIAGGLIAATLGIASATVGYYNSYGDGVKIYYTEQWVVWQFQYTYDYMRSQ
ncbi:hypothetical protein BM86_34115 [Bacillus thuringiensis]|uniref:Uncharacterized protein n=1 Tax=Bacillus thuringiensis TaxID=1428 RepID=A0A9W3S6P6_BACTU|nr:hypothetical protein [Bacillus thuringiensis]ANS45934.1 hypothetical protein BT246_04960 [Bacillus thuringiensis]MBH0340338.1 hypothetical protein [Bacillus thuringiensis]